MPFRLSVIVLSFALWLSSGAQCGGAPGPAPAKSPANAATPAAKTTLQHGPDTDKPVGVAAPPATAGYEIVNSYPHDCQAFTQGLEIHDGLFYESTGRNGFSSLRRVKPETGVVEKRVEVPPVYFAEGLTVLKNKIYQLTWQTQRGFVYDRATFAKLAEFTYEGEGWGLANDGQSLIMSDGVTNRLRFLNPETFQLERTLLINDETGRPLLNLNELEYVKGEIYANIWHANRLVRLDPATGRLLGWIDLTGLADNNGDVKPPCPPPEVLNGIAYDPQQDRLFVTGKHWPRLYEIRVKKAAK
jgi:glutamine cyclotransferase